uniref:Uncharacterized protein n=1 Tax=Setaria viridis TaxID=4556 RepID=A0A4U6UCP2_SETVI|nr:hypothetical protein SEVIR_5G068200v2 [Setaria viridis]
MAVAVGIGDASEISLINPAGSLLPAPRIALQQAVSAAALWHWRVGSFSHNSSSRPVQLTFVCGRSGGVGTDGGGGGGSGGHGRWRRGRGHRRRGGAVGGAGGGRRRGGADGAAGSASACAGRGVDRAGEGPAKEQWRWGPARRWPGVRSQERRKKKGVGRRRRKKEQERSIAAIERSNEG